MNISGLVLVPLASLAFLAPLAAAAPGANCNYVFNTETIFTHGPVCGAFYTAPDRLFATSVTLACGGHPTGGTVAPCQLQIYFCEQAQFPPQDRCTVQEHIPLI